MKITKIVILLLACVLLLAGCKKEDTDTAAEFWSEIEIFYKYLEERDPDGKDKYKDFTIETYDGKGYLNFEGGNGEKDITSLSFAPFFFLSYRSLEELQTELQSGTMPAWRAGYICDTFERDEHGINFFDPDQMYAPLYLPDGTEVYKASVTHDGYYGVGFTGKYDGDFYIFLDYDAYEKHRQVNCLSWSEDRKYECYSFETDQAELQISIRYIDGEKPDTQIWGICENGTYFYMFIDDFKPTEKFLSKLGTKLIEN